jgi:phosphate transport system substrate-binding protein
MFHRLGLLTLAVLLLGGCAAQPVPPVELPEATVLNGSASTSFSQIYFRWFNQLAVRDNVNVELSVVGSGEGIRRFLAGEIDFAGIDTPPSPQEIKEEARDLVAFPVTAGAIAVAYNLPGCDLRLSRKQLIDLFLGRITNFASLGCQNQPITVLHRRDSSGSTVTFTSALAAISPEWRQGPGAGRLVSWPVGQAVNGSDGMATMLSTTLGSVGYIESTYIRAPLQAAALQNRQGQFVRPDRSSGALALASFVLDSRLLGMAPDPASGYPIVNLNWMIAHTSGSSDRLQALKTSLTYILSQAGQDDAEQLGFVALPASIRERARGQLSRLAR